MPVSLNLLKINSEDVEERRKGALLQALIVVLTTLSVTRNVFEIFQQPHVSLQTAVSPAVTSLLFGLICL